MIVPLWLLVYKILTQSKSLRHLYNEIFCFNGYHQLAYTHMWAYYVRYRRGIAELSQESKGN